jgi:hypothetical protein
MDTWAPDENPLIRRYIHTRLRRGGAIAAFVATAAVCLVVMVVGSLIAEENRTSPADAARGIFFALLVVPGALLLILGSHRVAMAAALERTTGLLESLRMTPMHPGVCLTGFLIGPPIREFLLAFATVPFFAYCVVRGGVSFVEVFQYAAAMLVTAILFYLLSLISTFSSTHRDPRQRGGAASGMIFVLILYLILGPAVFRGGGPGSLALSFFGIECTLFFAALIVETFLIAFLAIGAGRKLARDGAPALSKRQAVVFFFLLHVLLLGLYWTRIGDTARLAAGTGGPAQAFQDLQIGHVVFGSLVGFWLVSMMVPTPIARLRELERSRRRGTRVRPDSEGASHVPWGLALAGLFALFHAIPPARLLLAGESIANLPPSLLLPPLLVASLLVYYGAAREYAVLRFRKGAAALLVVFFAGLWLLPPILGLLVSAGGGPRAVGAILASPSPVTGLVAAFAAIEGHKEALAGPAANLAAALACLAIQILLAAFFLRLLARVHARIRARGLYRPSPQADLASPPP